MKHTQMKTCSMCGETRPNTDEYFRYKGGVHIIERDPLSRWCVPCSNAVEYRNRRKRNGTFIGPPPPPGYRVRKGMLYRL